MLSRRCIVPKSSKNISVKKTLICLKSVVLVSRLTYFHYFLFQLVTVARSFIANFGTVIIMVVTE